MLGCFWAVWQEATDVMVQMPTGTGKTHLLAAVIHGHLQERRGQSAWIVATDVSLWNR